MIFLACFLGKSFSRNTDTDWECENRRRPKHRWMSNHLKARRMHWGPHRLF
jgi:hypothetical protein